ncbi:MAG: hypothetical protein JSR46_00200 [Verrucomicrobia bacterium]|nr:hypothetical protein [Verrucomicrobiota bacterium]
MSVDKHNFMFDQVNKLQHKKWTISPIYGEELAEMLQDRLSRDALQDVLMVIPAGESTQLDEAFSQEETSLINESVQRGMCIYGTCGSAYWMSAKRIWDDKCSIQPEDCDRITKTSSMGLFLGTAIGPLSPYPGQTYNTSFFHEAVNLSTISGQPVTVLLSGGGTFFVDEAKLKGQTVKTLAYYLPEELDKYQKNETWRSAVISCTCKRGKVIVAMVHPGYGCEDIHVATYNQAFPDRGDDWQGIRDRLSPLEERMAFVGEILRDFES